MEGSTVNDQTSPWVRSLPQEILLLIAQDLDAVDIKSLLLTCRTFSPRLGRVLIEADIREGTYNSLFWACLMGDPELAKASLLAGADPNVGFCHDPSHPPSDDNNDDDDAHFSRIIRRRRIHVRERRQPDHKLFRKPVFPTHFLYGKWLPTEDFACSPLTLATKLDHIAVMKVLLGFWDNPSTKPTQVSRLIENRIIPPRYVRDPPPRHRSRWAARHSVSLSHIRSVEAAELLLAAGENQGSNHVNSKGNLQCPPLALILMRHCHTNNPKPPKCRMYRGKRPRRPLSPHTPIELPELDEAKLEHIVELFLSSGANASAECTPSLPHYNFRQYYASPLFGAIETARPEIIKQIIEKSPLDFQNGYSDSSQALLLALKCQECVMLSCRHDHLARNGQDSHSHLLQIFLDNGVSPNVAIGSEMRALSHAICNNAAQCFDLLLKRGADPTFTDAHNLTPLAHSLKVVQNQFFFTLLESGVDVNQPSLHDNGFTPLMFAAGDLIPASKFERLLQEGADKGKTGRFSPNSDVYSLLQCILSGFPLPTSEFEVTRFEHHHIHKIRHFMPPNCKMEDPVKVYSCRKHKFESLISQSLDPSNFYTEDGRHVINWAIDNLFQDDLIFAIKLLVPYYASTKLPTDSENPLNTLFSPERIVGYLAFGTLPRTYEALNIMLEHDFHTNGVDINSILQSLSKINTKSMHQTEDPAWNAVTQTCNVGREGRQLLFDRIKADSQVEFLIRDLWDSAAMDGRHLAQQAQMAYLGHSYVPTRLNTIGRMMNLLLQKGANLYLQGPDGLTPSENATRNKTLQFIDRKWLDPRSDRRLSRSNNPTFVPVHQH